MSKTIFVTNVGEVSSYEFEGKEIFTNQIKVDGKVLATLSHENRDFLVQNSHDLARIVNFAFHFEADNQLQIALHSKWDLNDMFSLGSFACASILGESTGIANAIVQPQDGSPMWATLMMPSGPLTGDQVTGAARLVFAEFNELSKDQKRKFNLAKSAKSAINVVTKSGWTPSDVKATPTI